MNKVSSGIFYRFGAFATKNCKNSTTIFVTSVYPSTQELFHGYYYKLIVVGLEYVDTIQLSLKVRYKKYFQRGGIDGNFLKTQIPLYALTHGS